LNARSIVVTLPDGCQWTVRQGSDGLAVHPVEVIRGAADMVRREGDAVLGYIRMRWPTVREYAKQHRRFEQSVRASIKAGTLPALRIDGVYRIDPDALPPRPGVKKNREAGT